MTTSEYKQMLEHRARRETILALASDNPKEKRKHKKIARKYSRLLARLTKGNDGIEHANMTYKGGSQYE